MNDFNEEKKLPPSSSSSRPMKMNSNSSPNRRQLFANRMRTASSGSTRGAFGLLPVDASAHNPEDIYEKQQQNIRARRNFIGNTGTGTAAIHSNTHNERRHHQHQHQHQHHNYLKTGTGTGGNQQHMHHVQQDSKLNSFSNKKKAFHSPGESIDATNTNLFDNNTLADIVKGAQIHDEEQGRISNLGTGTGTGNAVAAPTYNQSSTGLHHQQLHPLNSSNYGSTNSNGPNATSMTINQNDYLDEGSPLNSDLFQNLPSPPYSGVNQNQMFDFHNAQGRNNGGGGGEMYDVAHAKQQYYSSMTRHNHHQQQYISESMKNGNSMNNNHRSTENSVNSRNNSNSSYDTDDDGIDEPFDDSNLTWFEYLVYNKYLPEFTSMQQNTWATILGIFMGVFTFLWGRLIEFCVEFTWKTVPEYLLEKGIFTDLDGKFPLPYYMIICPAVFGGVSEQHSYCHYL
jgi:hypothetical protein